MDRTFGSPRDVSNASPDDLARALNRVVRSLERPARYIYEAEYEYQNKRRAPLLMIGELRGPWREYVRRNAGSPRFSAGTCTVRRDEGGRVVLELAPERGRASGAAHARAVNAGLMRRVGGEVVFVAAVATADAATDGAADTAQTDAGSTTLAAPASTPRPVPDATPDTPTAPAARIPEAADILARFNAFKAAPTAALLEQLSADIEGWRARRAADPGAAPDPAAVQIEKLRTLLAQKGQAYVAAKSG
jgi:hypothetical protein